MFFGINSKRINEVGKTQYNTYWINENINSVTVKINA
jgi:hypothetical protein